MTLRCPGRESTAKMDTAMIACPGCGRQIEIFGDEQKVHCRCGKWVFRDAIPSCAQWCPAAEECFGNIAGVKKASTGHSCVSEELERFKDLQGRIKDAMEQCPNPNCKRTAGRPE